jgi:hypothetical protein
MPWSAGGTCHSCEESPCKTTATAIWCSLEGFRQQPISFTLQIRSCPQLCYQDRFSTLTSRPASSWIYRDLTIPWFLPLQPISCTCSLVSFLTHASPSGCRAQLLSSWPGAFCSHCLLILALVLSFIAACLFLFWFSAQCAIIFTSNHLFTYLPSPSVFCSLVVPTMEPRPCLLLN